MTMAREGKVRVIERERVSPAPPRSQTIVGLVGTGAGLSGLTDNTPAHYRSARAFLTAAVPAGETPAGTLYAAALGVNANVTDDIIVVESTDNTAANVDTAVDALENPADNRFPDIIAAPMMNSQVANGSADDVLGHLSDLCDSIDAVYFAQIANTGDTHEVQLRNAVAYAEANQRQRGILLYSMGRTAAGDVDVSAYAAGALARLDEERHRGANPRGLRLRGISRTSPKLMTNFQARGNQEDDIATLLAANIVPVIEYPGIGVILYGTRFSGYADSSPSPFKHVPWRRTADQIAIHSHEIAQPFLFNDHPTDIPGDLVVAMTGYMDTLRLAGQIRTYSVGIDSERQTADATAAGNIFLLIAFVPSFLPRSITITVEASSGTIVAAA